ncbi:VWA domain-containing protein [Candidatus Poribacteria bacterium]|nr:VWA domain-containing protein [Candidatus Poribacteria bacterium]MYK23891.1 VWA domain-containing protein [Candidatus Poribacteria bacterium]
MLNQLMNWRIEAQRRKNRMRSVILLSLILHFIILIVYLFLPTNQLAQEDTDVLAVDLLNDPEAPKKRKQKPKPPLTKKMYDPSEKLARDAMERKIESARNKMDEVVKLSPRVVLEDVEVNKAPVSEIVPDVMTDAKLRDAEASNLSRLIAQPGQTDGRGLVTGRVRAKGDGMGRFRGDGQGGGDGLLGGGGKSGTSDRLGIIDFLNEFGGPKDVIYCLDVSASMQAAGLRKLFLAVNALKDSVLMLGSEDTLNLITFSTTARAMSQKMLPANAASMERTLRYLDKFTPESIQGNNNTNILTALEVALDLDPSIIVLITDGLPTTSPNYPIEVNKDVILEKVREKNVNNAVIYVVALEINIKRSPGAKLLVSLAEEHNGKIKVVDTDLLHQYVKQDGPAE